MAAGEPRQAQVRSWLPAKHLPVPVEGDVGALPVVVGPEVAVWGPKPLVKAVPQGVELGLVPQVPANKTNTGSENPTEKKQKLSSSEQHARTQSLPKKSKLKAFQSN